MKYTLFIRSYCHDCDKVIAWLDANHIEYELDDIDHPKHLPYDGPRLFAAPALCLGPRLLAYGVDIIARLEKEK